MKTNLKYSLVHKNKGDYMRYDIYANVNRSYNDSTNNEEY